MLLVMANYIEEQGPEVSAHETGSCEKPSSIAFLIGVNSKRVLEMETLLTRLFASHCF